MRIALLGTLAVLVVAIGVLTLDVAGIGHTYQQTFVAPASPVVDGWSVGDELSCDAVERCQEYLDAATTQLAKRDPGHAPVANVSLHQEGRFYRDGKQVLWTRSGSCCLVVRFELTDGSIQAIGAGRPGVSPTVMGFDFGPVETLAGQSDQP